jgi:cytochrome bd ubiquinol oxidase subunit I
MVGLAFAMRGLGLSGLVARVGRRLYDGPSLHRAAVVMAHAGFVAVIAGWATIEAARHPYTVENPESAEAEDRVDRALRLNRRARGS